MTIFNCEVKDIQLYNKKGLLEIKTNEGNVLVYLYKDEIRKFSWKELKKIKEGTILVWVDCKIVEDEYVAFDIRL